MILRIKKKEKKSIFFSSIYMVYSRYKLTMNECVQSLHSIHAISFLGSNVSSVISMRASSSTGRCVCLLQIHEGCWHHLAASSADRHTTHMPNCKRQCCCLDIWVNLKSTCIRKRNTKLDSEYQLMPLYVLGMIKL